MASETTGVVTFRRRGVSSCVASCGIILDNELPTNAVCRALRAILYCCLFCVMQHSTHAPSRPLPSSLSVVSATNFASGALQRELPFPRVLDLLSSCQPALWSVLSVVCVLSVDVLASLRCWCRRPKTDDDDDDRAAWVWVSGLVSLLNLLCVCVFVMHACSCDVVGSSGITVMLCCVLHI